jgi:hypothetical protein
MIGLLIKLLPYVAPAINYADDNNRSHWRVDLLVYTLFVWVADIILAQLFFAPQRGEWTISNVITRTQYTSVDAKRLVDAIELVSPGHIKKPTEG